MLYSRGRRAYWGCVKINACIEFFKLQKQEAGCLLGESLQE